MSTYKVAFGVTLTMLPGTRVQSGIGDRIEAWGTLRAQGVVGNWICIHHVDLSGPVFDFQFTRFNGCRLAFSSAPSALKNCVVLSDSAEIPVYPDTQVSGNIFNGQAWLTTRGGAAIENNVFCHASGGVFGYQSPQVTVKGNNFLDCLTGVVSLGTGGALDATGNWWGTTDSTVIDGLIHDRNDDLSIANYVSYVPFLTAPNPPRSPALGTSYLVRKR